MTRTKIEIEFEMDNAAFDGYPMAEARRVIETVSTWLNGAVFTRQLPPLPFWDKRVLQDYNGNQVGSAEIELFNLED